MCGNFKIENWRRTLFFLTVTSGKLAGSIVNKTFDWFLTISWYFNIQFFCSISNACVPIGCGGRIRRLHFCRGIRPSHNNECSGYDTEPCDISDSSTGALGEVKYTFIAITPWWTLTWISSTCYLLGFHVCVKQKLSII